MPSQGEQALVLRQFSGINLSIDPAFLSPSQLQEAKNWVPDQQTYLLTKRRGTAAYQALTGSVSRVPCLIRVYDTSGNRILYAVDDRTAGVDRLQVSQADAAFGTLTGTDTFGSTNAPLYGAVTLGNRVYFGNGVDPIKYVDLTAPTVAADLTAILQTANDSAAVAHITAAVANTAAHLLGGPISYRWAIYNSVTKLFTNTGSTRTAIIIAGNSYTITAPATGSGATALGANELWHFFVAPPYLPVEFAHDQTPDGLGNGATFVGWSMINATSAPAPLPSVTRTGKFLVTHRNRVWLAGDAANPGRVYATWTILPGLEQAIYNRGDFFPADALINVNPNDGDVITGLSPLLASIQATDPRAPMVIFKNRATWLWYGDILDDPNAQLIQLSSYIGCIAHATIQATPIGLIFCGHDSVYLLAPGGQGPLDIGQDIWPQIRAIPRAERPKAVATYHKGFYKLAYASTAGGVNDTQLWLDCKRYTGQPSWWGPHVCCGVSAFATAQRDTAEDDRGFLAVENTGTVLLHDQTGSYADNGASINTRLRTASIVGGAPFQRKTFTRVRCNGQAQAATTMKVLATVDGGVQVPGQDMSFLGATGAQWNTATWDVSQFGVPYFEEVESKFATARPRGRYLDVQLTNNDPLRVDLRDFEITYLPVDRPTGPATVTPQY